MNGISKKVLILIISIYYGRKIIEYCNKLVPTTQSSSCFRQKNQYHLLGNLLKSKKDLSDREKKSTNDIRQLSKCVIADDRVEKAM